MEKFTVDGIVIKTAVTGENDLIIWVLTRNRGLIRAFAKGARGVKSRFHAAASQFAYSTCTFSEKNGVYNLSEAEIKNMFIELRNSLSLMTCAQYFCEVLLKTLPEGSDGEFYLRLLLNSLYLLCKGEKPVLLIKSVFELRLAAEEGYMPALVGCDTCGEYLTDMMYFDVEEGRLYCSDCGKITGASLFPSAVIAAMRHIVFADFDKIFSFELSAQLLPVLNGITEKYLSVCTRRQFGTLEFFDL